MLGMIGARSLVGLASAVVNVLSGGLFLTPRNLWNLSVQTASVAVMATGMVLVIVTRNIDLSVGSMLGFVGMIMGVLQAEILPQFVGFDYPVDLDHRARRRHRRSAPRSARFQGFIIAYLRRPRLHRHARRPARLARRRLVGDQRPHRRAAWTRPSS